MATFVLVHGGNISTDTWNRLTNRNLYPPGGWLGGRAWDGTSAYLTMHGHRVFAPTLPDEHTHNLSDHIELVCSIINSQDLKNIILVAHSYGGMVITGTAARVPERIRSMVYIDAALPDPGQSLFDLFMENGANPLSFAGLEATVAYVETLQFDPRPLQRLKKTYIFCTRSEFAMVTQGAKKKIAARGGGWTYLELPTSHVPMATMPQRLYRILEQIARQ